MNYRQTLAAASLVLALAGCASYSSSYQSDVAYRDGSYYSRADDNYGDYYYAPEPRADAYGYYGQDFFYGPGYCSVRYSYCPPFGYGIGNGGRFAPWGGGFGYGYYYPPRYYPGGRRHGGHDRDGDRRHRRDGNADGSTGMVDARTPGPDSAPVRPRPQPRWVAPEPRRAAPAPQAQRSPSPDSASRAEDRRDSRRRGQGD